MDFGPLPGTTVDPDTAAVGFNDRFTNRQAEAEAAYRRVGRVDPVEFIESLVDLIRCHTDPFIFDCNHQIIVSHCTVEIYCPAWRRILDGVAEQVVENPVHHVAIDTELHAGCRAISNKGVRRAFQAVMADYFMHQCNHFAWSPFEH